MRETIADRVSHFCTRNLENLVEQQPFYFLGVEFIAVRVTNSPYQPGDNLVPGNPLLLDLRSRPFSFLFLRIPHQTLMRTLPSFLRTAIAAILLFQENTLFFS
jgi:hypothetical protein